MQLVKLDRKMIPEMFAFVDETGNTGDNLFDETQPSFITAALITRSDFDIVYRSSVSSLARSLGVNILHANELGLTKIEKIAPEILKILKSADARFFLSRLDKKYLVTTKIVDTIFDAGENRAVSWHVYNLRPLRLLLVFKVAALLDDALAKMFWSSLMARRPEETHQNFVRACGMLLERVSRLPDERSRQIAQEAVGWAMENPEAIHLHSNGKLARQGHLPNLVAFVNLLDGIEQQSKAWNRPVRQIRHDRQIQFEKSLKEWHDIFANASPDPFFMPGGERHVFRRVFGSEFVMVSSENSSAIQVIDILLWLFKRVTERKELGEQTARIMRLVFRRAKQQDFSFEGVSRQLQKTFKMIDKASISTKHLQFAQEMLAFAELRRQKELSEYAERKLSFRPTE